MSLEINNTGQNSPIILGKDAMRNIRTKKIEDLTRDELLQKVEQEQLLIRKLAKRRTWPMLISAVFVLIAIGLYTLNDSKHITPAETFNKYYRHYTSLKGENSGLGAFFSKNYEEAAYTLQDEFTIDGRYLRAISLIESKKFKMAAAELKKIDGEDAQWLRALCLLRAENHKAVKPLLDSICSERGFFSASAEEILSEHYYNYSSGKPKN